MGASPSAGTVSKKESNHPHRRQPLKRNHRFDVLVRTRASVASMTASLQNAQPGNGADRLMNLDEDKFTRDAPLEHAFDSADLLVDVFPANP